MNTIRSIFRTMGEALTLADAGEMLSDAGKNNLLGRFQGSYPTAPDAVLPRLASETGLDFQVTRRQSDLLSEVDTYLCLRRDTLVILIQVGEDLRRRAERYRQRGRWNRSNHMPAISLYAEVPAT